MISPTRGGERTKVEGNTTSPKSNITSINSNVTSSNADVTSPKSSMYNTNDISNNHTTMHSHTLSTAGAKQTAVAYQAEGSAPDLLHTDAGRGTIPLTPGGDNVKTKKHVQADPRQGVAEELRTWREAFTVSMAKQRCRSKQSAYSVGIFCSGGCLDTFAAIRTGWSPQWSTEIDTQRAKMFEDLTGAPCLGDTFKTNFTKRKRVSVLWSGQPCPDFSTAHEGRKPPGIQGATGWQYTEQVRKVFEVNPRVCVLEMVPNALVLHDGAAVKELTGRLSAKFHVWMDVVKVAQYGDASARERLIIVGFNRDDIPREAAAKFTLGEPLFGQHRYHNAGDIAVPDSEVPAPYWRYDKVPMLPITMPEPLVMHKIARTGKGMGHSECPNSIQSWLGLFNTQTTHNGGGRRPMLSWQIGQPITRTRLAVPVETVRAASLPHDYIKWSTQFNTGENIDDDRHLRECVNMGVPVRSACCINEAVHNVLVRAGIPYDVQATSHEGLERDAMLVARAAEVEQVGRTQVHEYSKARSIQVDTGASATFVFTDIEPFMGSSRDSNTRIRVAAKGAMLAGRRDGTIRAHVLNTAGYPGVKPTTLLDIKATSVPDLSNELLSVDDFYRNHGYSVLLRQPGFEDGVSELYKPPAGGQPAVRVPLTYDWAGRGGWRMHYVPETQVDEADMELIRSCIKDADADRGLQASLAAEFARMHVDEFCAMHDAMAASDVVEEVITRHDECLNSTTKDKVGSTQNPKEQSEKSAAEKLGLVWAQSEAEREILGVKAGMRQEFKRMSKKIFHERMAHAGTHPDCKICKMAKGVMRRIFRKVDPYRETRPGHTWAMDGITFDTRSEQGCKYLVVLRDMASGTFHFIPLFRKTDIVQAFQDWVTSMRNNPIYANLPYPVVSAVRTDNEGTWMLGAEKWTDMLGELTPSVQMIYVSPDAHEKENGYAEAACQTVEHSIKSILLASNLPASWWQYAASSSLFILNRLPALSDDVNMPADGDRARPLEILTRGYMSRRMIDRELTYFITCGTPALVHDSSVKGSSLRPKTRWGVACGMYRDQPIWWCPYTKVTFRSKSYSAYRLQNGLNYAQFLKIPIKKSAQSQMHIPDDDIADTDVVVHLPDMNDDELPDITIADETAKIRAKYGRQHSDPSKLKLGGTTRVIDSEGNELETDLSTGELHRKAEPVVIDAPASDDEEDEEEEIEAEPAPIPRREQEPLPRQEQKDDTIEEIAHPDAGEEVSKDENHRTRKGKRSRTQVQRLHEDGSMLSDTQRAKKLARVTAQDRQEPNTQERHGIDLEVLEGGDSPDMFEMFELRQGDDDEMARNWEQAVIAPLGATLSSLVKKQPLGNALPTKLVPEYRKWLIETYEYLPEDIPLKTTKGRAKPNEFVKPGTKLPIPGGREWQRRVRISGLSKSHIVRQQIENAKCVIEAEHALYIEQVLLGCYRKETIEEAMQAAKTKKKKEKTVATGEIPPPGNFSDAFRGDNAHKWVESADKEMDGLTDKGVVEHGYNFDQLRAAGVPVDPKTNRINPIPLSVVLDHKYVNGVLDRYKTRLAVAGHSGNMRKGEHFDKTFAASPNSNSTRVLQALMVYKRWGRLSFDIDQAYLHAPLPPGKLIALRYPDGFKRYDDKGRELYMLLKRNLYGHPAASRQWSRLRDKVILNVFNSAVETDAKNAKATERITGKWTCTKCRMDPCLFKFTRTIGEKKEEAIALIYTDDCDIVGESDSMMQEMYDAIHAQWGAKIVNPEFVLGVHRRMKKDQDTMEIEMTMTAFVDGMVEGLREAERLDEKRVDTPFPEKTKLSRVGYQLGWTSDEEVKEVLDRGYMRVIGQLLWCARNVFAECATGVSMLCRVMSSPTYEAWDAAMHMVKWIHINRKRGLRFYNPGASVSQIPLVSKPSSEATPPVSTVQKPSSSEVTPPVITVHMKALFSEATLPVITVRKPSSSEAKALFL